ncbi:hypothetical protein CARUB_v10024371mg [Capsella rubella]|uniref:Uncharacterized protein n=1 Tax=Capsella rubella TaxID=81985 RepID=R0FZD7_9BRAS|nr:hypothetical protein CARUB_v10024371mg [Capsella rubella]
MILTLTTSKSILLFPPCSLCISSCIDDVFCNFFITTMYLLLFCISSNMSNTTKIIKIYLTLLHILVYVYYLNDYQDPSYSFAYTRIPLKFFCRYLYRIYDLCFYHSIN